jgi:hypothetical protein
VRRVREVDPARAWLIAPPTEVIRWRLELECGHVVERLTTKSKTPLDLKEPDRIHGRYLPMGEFFCFEQHGDRPFMYRQVIEWGERRTQDFEPEPAECPEGKGPELYELMRRKTRTTKAFWKVTLECGHGDEICTSVDWLPEHDADLADQNRRAEMALEHDAYLTTDPPRTEREKSRHDHYRRMIDIGWPLPTPEQACHTCQIASGLVAYQRVGWLQKPPPKPKPPLTKEQRLRERLERAEAEVAKVQRQLEDLDGGPDETDGDE